jgi:hypothetical protein
MADQRLVDYVKGSLSRGMPVEQIREILAAQGWTQYDINDAIYSAIDTSVSAPLPTTPQNKEPAKKSGIPLIIIILIIGVPILIVIILIIAGVTTGFFKGIPGETEITVPTGDTQPDTKQLEDAQTPQEPSEGPAGVTNCGTDFDCLIAASQTCKQAYVTHAYSIEFFGMIQTTISYYEINGLVADKCEFYMKTESVDAKLSNESIQQMLADGATMQEIQEVEQQLSNSSKISEGLDGTCGFIPSDLTAMLTRWKGGNFETGVVSCHMTPDGNECSTAGGDFAVADCTGSMFYQDIIT